MPESSETTVNGNPICGVPYGISYLSRVIIVGDHSTQPVAVGQFTHKSRPNDWEPSPLHVLEAVLAEVKVVQWMTVMLGEGVKPRIPKDEKEHNQLLADDTPCSALVQ